MPSLSISPWYTYNALGQSPAWSSPDLPHPTYATIQDLHVLIEGSNLIMEDLEYLYMHRCVVHNCVVTFTRLASFSIDDWRKPQALHEYNSLAAAYMVQNKCDHDVRNGKGSSHAVSTEPFNSYSVCCWVLYHNIQVFYVVVNAGKIVEEG